MASKKDDGGLSDVLADMDSIKDIPRSEYVRSALLKSAKEFAGTAKALAPKDTGALADSVVVTGPGETTPPHSQPGASRVAGPHEVIVTAGNTDVRYAHLVEYGTSKTEAHPFFGAAFNLTKTRNHRRLNRALDKAWKNR
ncbi:HK97 gp10 family phage protein [Martelella mediterranea]|uniref:HK97-gp10 family putative phage morphogenesis protein n=1 Tax=Martelella mediterranea TaxID=293089 RepID=UPI001E58ECB2|nr:HK97-gp10 family putative phage morphogenesis protein [Martelella mediterranea]MCD1634546.1 HK97 gp10 family phage protein [Martelella mediterranea]